VQFIAGGRWSEGVCNRPEAEGARRGWRTDKNVREKGKARRGSRAGYEYGLSTSLIGRAQCSGHVGSILVGKCTRGRKTVARRNAEPNLRGKKSPES